VLDVWIESGRERRNRFGGAGGLTSVGNSKSLGLFLREGIGEKKRTGGQLLCYYYYCMYKGWIGLLRKKDSQGVGWGGVGP
jgi:hypothetical protein